LNTEIANNKRSIRFSITPDDNERLQNLCGQFDQHLRLLETHLSVDIQNRGHQFNLIGNPEDVQYAQNILIELYNDTKNDVLTPESLHLFLRSLGNQRLNQKAARIEKELSASIRTKRGLIKARGVIQQDYIENIRRCDLSFGIGPAGTGKTYLAVACAVEALEKDRVRRIVLVRPAVEAGEKLGFLPGDLAQKVDPYLRPMYDALYEMLGFDKVTKLLERNVIEVAPLAYMRGRTLNDAFIILDEAQNTTPEQMKMFLTRLGFGSTAVVTGDITQVDLATHQRSGLKHVAPILEKVKGVSFAHFSAKDVVRHKLVQRIVEAYEAQELSS
jgi:phosphate starvation-inducible PhoH-like protein